MPSEIQEGEIHELLTNSLRSVHVLAALHRAMKCDSRFFSCDGDIISVISDAIYALRDMFQDARDNGDETSYIVIKNDADVWNDLNEAIRQFADVVNCLWFDAEFHPVNNNVNLDNQGEDK